MNAADLKIGDRVQFYSITATIDRAPRKNGIWISYWGRGLQADQLIRARVSINDIKPFNKSENDAREGDSQRGR